jgi:hypothetical protein
MPEREPGREPSPWADPTEMKEPEPDWAREIRARRKARAERLRKVFEELDGRRSTDARQDPKSGRTPPSGAER